jgi:hypothetical protein
MDMKDRELWKLLNGMCQELVLTDILVSAIEEDIDLELFQEISEEIV